MLSAAAAAAAAATINADTNMVMLTRDASALPVSLRQSRLSRRQTGCNRVDLRPSCEQYLEMGHCDPSSVLYDYMSTSCLATCVDVPCPGAATTAAVKTLTGQQPRLPPTTDAPIAVPVAILSTTLSVVGAGATDSTVSTTLLSTSSTSTVAPSTSNTALNDVTNVTPAAVGDSNNGAGDGRPGATVSNPASAAATATTAPPVRIQVTLPPADGQQEGTTTLSNSDTINVILIAIGASVLSTVIGVACVIYRYEGPPARKKLAKELAISLLAANNNTPSRHGSNASKNGHIPPGFQAAATDSRPPLLGLLDSSAGMNAVVRAAARQHARVANRVATQRNRTNMRMHHSDGVRPDPQEEKRKNTAYDLESYLASRAASAPSTRTGRVSIAPPPFPTDRMAVLLEQNGASNELRKASGGGTGGFVPFKVGKSSHPNRMSSRRPNNRRPSEPASTNITMSTDRDVVAAQLPANSGGVIPDFADTKGFYNVYGLIDGGVDGDGEGFTSGSSSSTEKDDDDGQTVVTARHQTARRHGSGIGYGQGMSHLTARLSSEMMGGSVKTSNLTARITNESPDAPFPRRGTQFQELGDSDLLQVPGGSAFDRGRMTSNTSSAQDAYAYQQSMMQWDQLPDGVTLPAGVTGAEALEMAYDVTEEEYEEYQNAMPKTEGRGAWDLHDEGEELSGDEYQNAFHPVLQQPDAGNSNNNMYEMPAGSNDQDQMIWDDGMPQ
jgi:hypothetical protein